MADEDISDEAIIDILSSTKVIALVGASANTARPAFGVMSFLLRRGYVVHPVNPGLAGQEVQGQRVYARLADVPGPIDMVDVFRNSAAVPALVDEILKLPDLPKVIWMQLGVVDHEAAAWARARDIKVVMNRCPAIEIPRLAL